MSIGPSKILKLSIILVGFISLTAFSSLDYTHKVIPLEKMPKGDLNPNVGIVVRPHSTGMDVLADSSQTIRFTALENFRKNGIERLSSSSLVDRTPKKLSFLNGKNSFISDSIYEFWISFDSKNHEWQYMQFMPFRSASEWVTEEKLMIYLSQWVKIFDEAGWERTTCPKFNKPHPKQNFTLPNFLYNMHPCCWTWKTNQFKGMINIKLRDSAYYKNYIPKKDRKNIIKAPEGYIIFINILRE